MRKTIVILLLSLFVVCSVFSFDAAYFPVSSEEWKLTDDICRIAGVAGPSSFGPVTGHQLLLALDRAEKKGAPSALVEKAREMISYFDSFYSDDLGAVALEGEINLEMYLQTNGEEFSAPAFGYDDIWFIRGYRERPSTLSLKLENTIGDFLYSRMVLPVVEKQIQNEYYWSDSSHYGIETKNLESNFPFDAGFSLASKSLSLITGRGKVSQGEGFTGNTAVGDNYDYQEFLKLGANTRNTGIFLTLTTFDSSRASIHDSNRKISEPWRVQNEKFSGYRELRHSVGYEMTLFDKTKMSLSLITLLDTTAAFDFRYLNPFMVMHNLFNYHEDTILEANNMISLDCSLAFLKGWRLYLQITMDQFQLVGEAEGYDKDYGYTDPNAFAGLMNISWSKQIGDEGILTLYGEAVYTMPGMYLNQKYYDESGNVTQFVKTNKCWSQDYLLGYNRTEAHKYGSDDGDMAFAGYIYGPDAIALSFGGKYSESEHLEVKGNLFCMLHGEKGRGVNHNNYNFYGIDKLETVNAMSPTGVVERTVAIEGECSVEIKDGIYLYMGAALSSFRNYMNEEGRDFSNLQTALGIKLVDAV